MAENNLQARIKELEQLFEKTVAQNKNLKEENKSLKEEKARLEAELDDIYTEKRYSNISNFVDCG